MNLGVIHVRHGGEDGIKCMSVYVCVMYNDFNPDNQFLSFVTIHNE